LTSRHSNHDTRQAFDDFSPPLAAAGLAVDATTPTTTTLFTPFPPPTSPLPPPAPGGTLLLGGGAVGGGKWVTVPAGMGFVGGGGALEAEGPVSCAAVAVVIKVGCTQ